MGPSSTTLRISRPAEGNLRSCRAFALARADGGPQLRRRAAIEGVIVVAAPRARGQR
jgi:hypothetical protein